MKNQKPEWDVYCEMRTRFTAKVNQAKEDKKEACEMENSEVRFYDVGSSKGRLPFLQKVGQCLFLFLSIYYVYFQILPDVAEPPVYWLDSDLRALAAHFGIICQMVIDFQPFSFVTNKGFLIDKRKTMPMFQVHSPWWYQDKIEKVSFFNAFAKIILFFKRADNGFMNNIIHNRSHTINIDHQMKDC